MCKSGIIMCLMLSDEKYNFSTKIHDLRHRKEHILMMIAILFIVMLLIVLLPVWIYVRSHRMKDIHVKLALFSGIDIKCSFYKN
nr:MAG TPA: hypothetical protein [Bacteriophage sp.]